MTPDDVKKLEVQSRLGMSTAVAPHGICESKGWTITFQGVSFFIPPLIMPEGVQFVPKLGESVSVDIRIDEGEADKPLVELAEKIRESAPITEGEKCPHCGKPDGSELEIDLEKHQAFLCLLVEYAAAILRRQYKLEDAQIESLLAFDGTGLPDWITQVIYHVHGSPTNPNALPAFLDIV